MLRDSDFVLLIKPLQIRVAYLHLITFPKQHKEKKNLKRKQTEWEKESLSSKIIPDAASKKIAQTRNKSFH